MNLAQLRTEVLAHGFDPNVFTGRITNYLNDAQFLIARRVNYYTSEATQAISTVAGTSMIPFPADMARARELFDTVRTLQLTSVTLAEIDRSSTSNGPPVYYALDGANVHLYPTPDGVYQLELRYWKLPAALVADGDVPSLPADYHNLLWLYAVMECFAGEDDPQTAQYWQQRFQAGVAAFAADVKFPNTDRPAQAKGMWDQGDTLPSPGGWSLYGYGW